MSKAKANVDPVALRMLADQMSTLASAIRERNEALDAGLSRLGATFQDAHYAEFRGLFMNTRRTLDAFVDDVRQVVPILRRDADDIEASQRERVE